jgi:hypothetical protein
LPFKCNLQRYNAVKKSQHEVARLENVLVDREATAASVEDENGVAAREKARIEAGLYKLNPAVTDSLKAPGDPTLEPIK